MSRPTTDQVTDQYTVKDAARHLGISENAVMQRIKRGTVNARKHDGRWLVTVVSEATDQESTGRTDHHQPAGDHEPDWSTDHEATSSSPAMLALSYQALAPIMERMEAIARDNGRLQERIATTDQKLEAANRGEERERAGRIRAEEKLEEANAELVILREIRRHDEPEPEPPTDSLIDPQERPGREETAAMGQDTLHEPSHVTSWLRRLFGRSE